MNIFGNQSIFVRFESPHPIYNVSQKNQADLFLSELRQIFTDFDNFWQKDGKRSKYMRGAIIFQLT